MTDGAPFRFNNDYRDDEQVMPYRVAYLARLTEITDAGEYPYNDSFKGHLGMSAATSKDEDSAIYLLQGWIARCELAVRVAACLADGYVELVKESISTTPTKYAGIVHFGWYMGGTGYQEWESARILRGGPSVAYVIPKGKRTNGHHVFGRILVKR